MRGVEIGKIRMVNDTYGYQVIKMNGGGRACPRGYVKVWKVERLFGEVERVVIDRALTVKQASHIIKRLNHVR